MHETRIALRNYGKISPESIDDYIAAGGYQALEKATNIPPIDLITEVERSGKLRGRGGAGFNTGLKWRSAYNADSDKKYVVCNADEGEPGTYKDRIILESDPHSVIEGMLICAYAIGADEGYIYCRGEYPHIIDLLEKAIADVREVSIMDGVKLSVVRGAGAYVCGEETALLNSMEGKRGEPRLKPPFPTVSGLFGKPTVVNNVETFASIPPIIQNGAEWFRAIGSPEYPGTKIFVLSGDVKQRQFAEVATNTSLMELIEEVGGGIKDGHTLKAVQIGGSSCPFIPAEMTNTTVDFDTLHARGASLGSGSILVIDDSHNIVDILVPITRFFAHESCGQCIPCREGTIDVYKIIDKISRGDGTEEDIERLKKLDRLLSSSSFCPLGQSATVAVMSALKYFEADFREKLKIGGKSI